MHLDMATPDGIADFGTLSSKTISTNNDGRASVVYAAARAGPRGVVGHAVTIFVTPIGSNYQNANARSVEIRLTRPGVILPPNGRHCRLRVAAKPHENETILFDASPSKDDGRIVNFVWSFGDGGGAAGPSPTHSYEVAGDYVASLTVTDDRGLTSTMRKTVSVSAEENPTANFTFSPTSVKVGANVIFNASSSTVPPGRDIGVSGVRGDGGSGRRSAREPHACAAGRTRSRSPSRQHRPQVGEIDHGLGQSVVTLRARVVLLSVLVSVCG
jgi:hypothetical protein